MHLDNHCIRLVIKVDLSYAGCPWNLNCFMHFPPVLCLWKFLTTVYFLNYSIYIHKTYCRVKGYDKISLPWQKWLMTNDHDHWLLFHGVKHLFLEKNNLFILIDYNLIKGMIFFCRNITVWNAKANTAASSENCSTITLRANMTVSTTHCFQDQPFMCQYSKGIVQKNYS